MWSSESNADKLSYFTDRWLLVLNLGKRSLTFTDSLNKRIAAIKACQELMYKPEDGSDFFTKEIIENVKAIKLNHSQRCLEIVKDLPESLKCLSIFKSRLCLQHARCNLAEKKLIERVRALDNEITIINDELMRLHADIGDDSRNRANNDASALRLERLNVRKIELEKKMKYNQFFLRKTLQNREAIIPKLYSTLNKLKSARLQLEVLQQHFG